MNRHSEALAAFATAVAHDPGSQQLLQTLIEAGIKSPLEGILIIFISISNIFCFKLGERFVAVTHIFSQILCVKALQS